MKIKSILYVGVCAVFFWACGKDDNGPEPLPEPNPVQQPEPEQPKDTVVYVAGVQINGYGKGVATLWTNTIPEELSDGFSTNVIKGMEVIDNTIYLAGIGINGNGRNIAKIWENGEETLLTNEEDQSDATAICLYNDDVFITGNYGGDGILKIWSNGSETDVTDGTFYSYASDITVNEIGSYISGHIAKTHEIATIWKNGTPIELTNGSSNARANAIFLADGDVYAGGFENNSNGISMATIWKNGLGVRLTDGTYQAQVLSIYVIGNAVYAGGWQYDGNDQPQAMLWKNGIPMDLDTQEQKSSAITKITLVGNDIYACGGLGSDIAAEYRAVVWKNGKSQLLESPYAVALARDLKIVIE